MSLRLFRQIFSEESGADLPDSATAVAEAHESCLRLSTFVAAATDESPPSSSSHGPQYPRTCRSVPGPQRQVWTQCRHRPWTRQSGSEFRNRTLRSHALRAAPRWKLPVVLPRVRGDAISQLRRCFPWLEHLHRHRYPPLHTFDPSTRLNAGGERREKRVIDSVPRLKRVHRPGGNVSDVGRRARPWVGLLG